MIKYRIEIKWAVIFTVMMMLWLLLERAVGLHGEHIHLHARYTNLVAIPAIIIYYLALNDKRNHYYGGTMTYGQGFGTGAIITVIVTVLSPLAQYITHTIITPDYFPNVIDYAVQEELMTREEAEQYFSLRNYAIQAAMGSLFMGLVTSAVVAWFTRSKKA